MSAKSTVKGESGVAKFLVNVFKDCGVSLGMCGLTGYNCKQRSTLGVIPNNPWRTCLLVVFGTCTPASLVTARLTAGHMRRHVAQGLDAAVALQIALARYVSFYPPQYCSRAFPAS